MNDTEPVSFFKAPEFSTGHILIMAFNLALTLWTFFGQHAILFKLRRLTGIVFHYVDIVNEITVYSEESSEYSEEDPEYKPPSPASAVEIYQDKNHEQYDEAKQVLEKIRDESGVARRILELSEDSFEDSYDYPYTYFSKLEDCPVEFDPDEHCDQDNCSNYREVVIVDIGNVVSSTIFYCDACSVKTIERREKIGRSFDYDNDERREQILLQLLRARSDFQSLMEQL